MNRLTEFVLTDAEPVLKALDLAKLADKHIMITGSSGLIGHYLLASLAKASMQGLSFKLSAIIHHEPEAHLKELISLSQGNVYIGDVTDSAFMQELPIADYVIHAAGYGQPGKFMVDPIKTILLNTLGTKLLLDKVKDGGAFLFVSSSEVYSGSTQLPYTEAAVGATMPTHQRACYIEGKRCGEALTLAYSHRSIKRVIARLSLAYGPGTRVNDERVLNQFIQKGIQGQINLLDAGKSLRTYCYVTDAVELLFKMLLEGKEPLYNVGGHSRVSIRELAEKVGQELNVPVNIPSANSNVTGAPEDVSLDMRLAEKEFCKDTYVSFDTGLSRTINWQRLIYEK